MSEWRADPVTGQWVIVATDTQPRRRDFDLDDHPSDDDGPCPLCEGREHVAGRELLAVRQGSPADAPGWDLRVVPNRVPVLRVEAGGYGARDGLLEHQPGLGAHEVVVESPRHDASWFTMSADELARVLRAWRDRMADLRRDTRMRSALAFKNHGVRAGARLSHPHSQVVAMPRVPPRIDDEVKGAERHHAATGRCVFCDLVAQEVGAGTREVAATASCVALAPYASRAPFEVCLIPRGHGARFEAASADDIAGVAEVLRHVLGHLDAQLGRPAFNAVLHSAPYGTALDAAYHWHLELVPRVLRATGFAIGTGTAINPVSAERAARVLRGAAG
jgi:UDPglucose--hexose-1-phosphate uridylyltransferase